MRLARLLVAAALLAAPAARAQSDASASDVEAARTAFQEGLELRDRGHDPRGAVVKLKAAYSFVQTPRIAYELGRTYRMTGDLVAARDTFLEVERLPVHAHESDEAKHARADARAQASDLESRIPTLAIDLTGGGSAQGDASITIDDQPAPRDSLATPRQLNPGSHAIALELPGRPAVRRTVALREGERKRLQIKLPAPNAPPSQDPEGGFQTTSGDKTTTRADALHQTLLWSAVGFVAVGSVTGIYAIATAADAAKSCNPACSSSALDQKSTATALAWVANVSFAVGLAAGIAWIAIPAVEVRGASVGLAPAPGGAFLSARGTF